jgi:hypothetical protein
MAILLGIHCILGIIESLNLPLSYTQRKEDIAAGIMKKCLQFFYAKGPEILRKM